LNEVCTRNLIQPDLREMQTLLTRARLRPRRCSSLSDVPLSGWSLGPSVLPGALGPPSVHERRGCPCSPAFFLGRPPPPGNGLPVAFVKFLTKAPSSRRFARQTRHPARADAAVPLPSRSATETSLKDSLMNRWQTKYLRAYGQRVGGSGRKGNLPKSTSGRLSSSSECSKRPSTSLELPKSKSVPEVRMEAASAPESCAPRRASPLDMSGSCATAAGVHDAWLEVRAVRCNTPC